MSRREILKGGAAAALGTAGLVVVGCGGTSTGSSSSSPATGGGPTPTPLSQQPKKGGTLKVGQIADFNLNTGHPFALLPSNGLPNSLVHEPLVRYRDSLQPELVLVDRFEFNADHTKLTTSLLPGLTFHNGGNVTPEDVFFGIDLMLNPTKYNVTGSFQLATFAQFIVDKQKVDDRTMQFTFDKPRVNIADFFAQLLVTQASNYANLRTGKDVQGTGPYKWKSWSSGQSFSYVTNTNWHGTAKEGGPYLDAIEGSFFADQDALGLAFESGDVELVMGNVSGAIASRFRDKKETRVAPKAGLAYCGCNVQNPLLTDKRVRQAMFLAIDRTRFAQELNEGFTEVTSQPWPKTSPAFDPALEVANYDPAKAKDLLRQAGFTQDKPLVLEYAGTTWPNEAALLKENFAAIGVNVQLAPMEANAFTTKFTARKLTDLWISAHAFADISPLTNFQQTFPYRIPNVSYFDDPDYLKIISDLEAVDPLSPQAKAIYQRFNTLWLDQAWLLPFQSQERIDLVGDKVQGFDQYFITPSGSPNFGKVWKTA